MSNDITDKGYLKTLESLKQTIQTAQIKAHLAVNREMLILYWQIGKTILDKQKQEGWGSKVIKQLSKDLTSAFPSMKGFSTRNLEFMQQFAATYEDVIPKQLVSELESPPIFMIPWGHNICLMQKLSDISPRLWYAQQTISQGWSRNVLAMQIETDLYSRQAITDTKINNFELTLPASQSDLAQQILKDSYKFDFIDYQGNLAEKHIEKGLVDNIRKFLLELGTGFAFMGQQYHLHVAGQDFYLDLLFYHTKLKAHIVIELKAGKFKPEYVGKMGFYLSCVDDYLRTEGDHDSIGIILCQDDNKEIQSRSLNCMIKPIGISSYKLAKNNELPEELKPLEQLKDIVQNKITEDVDKDANQSKA